MSEKDLQRIEKDSVRGENWGQFFMGAGAAAFAYVLVARLDVQFAFVCFGMISVGGALFHGSEKLLSDAFKQR